MSSRRTERKSETTLSLFSILLLHRIRMIQRTNSMVVLKAFHPGDGCCKAFPIPENFEGGWKRGSLYYLFLWRQFGKGTNDERTRTTAGLGRGWRKWVAWETCRLWWWLWQFDKRDWAVTGKRIRGEGWMEVNRVVGNDDGDGGGALGSLCQLPGLN